MKPKETSEHGAQRSCIFLVQGLERMNQVYAYAHFLKADYLQT